MPKLNRFQRFAVRRYDNGDGGYCRTTTDVEGYGDGLLRFLVTELSEQEGCDGYDEMVRRLNMVQGQIEELIARADEPREVALLTKSKKG